MQTRIKNAKRYGAYGAMFIGLPMVAAAFPLEYLGVYGGCYNEKQSELGVANGCTFTSYSDEDGFPYTKMTSCPNKNITEWINDTAARYGEFCVEESLKIALPVIIVGSLFIGSVAGALYGFCKKPEPAAQDVQLSAPSILIEGSAVSARADSGVTPLLNADTLSSSSVTTSSPSNSVYTRGTLYSQAQAKQAIQARTDVATTLAQPASPSAINRVV